MSGISPAAQTFNHYFDAIAPCVGKDDYEHSLHVATNELEQEVTLERLSKMPMCGNTAFGVAGFFLLNCVAHRNQDAGSIENIIIVDRSLRVEHFWGEMQRIITSSPARNEVIDKVRTLLDRQALFYWSGGKSDPRFELSIELDLFNEELRHGYSWLASDEKFSRIKKIFDSNRFVFKRLDLCNEASFAMLAQIFKEKHITIDTAYLSNCIEMVQPRPAVLDYFNVVEHVIGPDTHVIHTSRSLAKTENGKQTYKLAQIVSQKKDGSAKEIFLFPPIIDPVNDENGNPAPGSIRVNHLFYANLQDACLQ